MVVTQKSVTLNVEPNPQTQYDNTSQISVSNLRSHGVLSQEKLRIIKTFLCSKQTDPHSTKNRQIMMHARVYRI